MTFSRAVIMRTFDIARISGELNATLFAYQDLLLEPFVVLRLDTPGILVPRDDGFDGCFYDIHALFVARKWYQFDTSWSR